MSDYIRVNCTHCDARNHYYGDGDEKQCTSCGGWFQVKEGKINHYKETFVVEKLKDGPCPLKKLDSNRRTKVQLFRKLKRPHTQGSGKSRSGGRKRTGIAYLPGDERRAVTLFIKYNTEYVASCMNDKNNPLKNNWDEEMYQLLSEQWHWCDFDIPGEQE